jgi:hypothetical protein
MIIAGGNPDTPYCDTLLKSTAQLKPTSAPFRGITLPAALRKVNRAG